MTPRKDRVPYYVVRERGGAPRAYWQPSARMRQFGFVPVALGYDDEQARQTAREWNARWQAVRVQRKQISAYEAAKREAGFVYFYIIQGRVKIGFSRNPFARYTGLGTSVPERVSFYGFFPAERREERALHSKLNRHRIKGEWFTDHSDVLGALFAKITSSANPARTLRVSFAQKSDGPGGEARTPFLTAET